MAEEYKGEAYCVKCKEKRAFEGHVKVQLHQHHSSECDCQFQHLLEF